MSILNRILTLYGQVQKYLGIAMIIREARAEDAEALVPLMADLGYDSSLGDLRACVEVYAGEPRAWAYVVEIEGKLAATASYHYMPYFHRRGGLLRITAIVVGAQFRRRGIGRILLGKADELAIASGCDKIELTSGGHRAHEAHRFYESMGFIRYDGIRYLRDAQQGATFRRK
jgi:GNAT superfamily N-acetyltransferase